MDKDKLLQIIEDDDLGLLVTKPKASSAIQPEERLIASFEEINAFIDKNGVTPESNGKDVNEFRLHKRLESLCTDTDKSKSLKDYDRYNLLTHAKKLSSIADIFEDDDLGILNDGTDSIFTIKNIPKETTMPEYVARRKTCENFEQYEPLFKQCHADLVSGHRKLRQFSKEQQIDKGLFFVLKGIMLYVDEIGQRELIKGKYNARLRCVFENGTESDMLLRSLSAELYKDGRRITDSSDTALEDFENITEEDTSTGYIYILKSLSQNPDISSIENLYKIGFSTTPVAERIKSASQEPTYLYAAVSIITSFQCFNLNPQKLEQMLHTFFGSACLDIDLYDKDGKRFIPREWFVAPLSVIEQAVTLLINGEIVHYKYDITQQEIRER